MENLADDLQRLMSLMLELDAKTQGKRSRSRSTVERPSRVLAQLRQLRPQFQTYVKSFSDDGEGDADRRSLYKDVLQGILRCREFGDEKIQYSSQMQELVRRLSLGGGGGALRIGKKCFVCSDSKFSNFCNSIFCFILLRVVFL